MKREEAHLTRVKRIDRIMTWTVSFGGVLIIAAVLGILLFIAKEAYPLFRSPKVGQLAATAFPASAGLLVDESTQAALALDTTRGVTAHRLPGGEPLNPVNQGQAPALPWKHASTLTATGHIAVIGQDGRVSHGELKWEKPPSENNPAAWTPLAQWSPAQSSTEDLEAIYHVKVIAGSGLSDSSSLRIVARAHGKAVWAEVPSEGTPQPIAWKAINLPAGESPQAALWNNDGRLLFVGTKQGVVHLLTVEGEAQPIGKHVFGEPVSALGFVLGQTSLLVGGEQGRMIALQALRTDKGDTLQLLHHFQPQSGPVRGFMASLRDKRFLSWTPDTLAVDHLTTERRLFLANGKNILQASLAPKGNHIYAISATGEITGWTLDVPHSEVSGKTLWGKVHYESYDKPAHVWQSTGGTDDFEPKMSLLPLLFGTLKGTLYAMLFALPLAIFGALYVSQFASPRMRNTIKPIVEVMAALPSVVLGFMAGLVLAPLFERGTVQILFFPFCALLVLLACIPFWSMVPKTLRTRLSHGREVLWIVPVIFAGFALSWAIAPFFERVLLGGDFRLWLLSHHNVTYDQRNSIVVGFAMGFAVIPIIFSISEDALSSVPRSLTSASLACGASPWQTAWRVVLPTASPGLFSAVMVGFGRAIGETMIVLMAAGNTPIMEWNPFNGMRTLAANIAVEVPEAPVHGTLYRVLFLTAVLLFGLTFILNTLAEVVRQHLRKRYESF